MPMHTFFHGWRRKTGMVTLVMACVFMGAWVRGHFIVDRLSYHPKDGPMQWLATSPHRIEWARSEQSGQFAEDTFLNFRWESGPDPFATMGFIDRWDGWHVLWNWECCGFQFGAFQRGTKSIYGQSNSAMPVFAEIGIWMIPFWAVVIPLTLLSGHLILWEPRKRGSLNL